MSSIVRVKANAGLVILPNGVEVPDSDTTQDIEVDEQTFVLIDPGMIGTLAGTDEVREITVDATAGTFDVICGGGRATLDFDVDAADFQAALEALPLIGEGNVEVTGGPGDDGGTTPYVITFVGDLAATPVATWDRGYVGQPRIWTEGVRPFIIEDGDLTGSAVIETTTEGRAGDVLEDVTP